MKHKQGCGNKSIRYGLDSKLLSNLRYDLKPTTTNSIMLTQLATQTDKFKIYKRVNRGLTYRLEYYVGLERKNSPERCKLTPDNTEISKLKLKLKLTPKPVLFCASCLESETSYLNRDDSRTTTFRLFVVLSCFGIINETR